MKNFNQNTMAVFSAMGTNYDEMNNLMQDVALGRELYDDESDRKISKTEANAKILDFSRQVLGIKDIKDAKAVRRAIRDNGREWFDIIEDTVDKVIEVGLKESDWFNTLVDSKNIAFGNRQDFIVETNDAILSVAKAGTQHHDHILQRLNAYQTIPLTTDLYVVKVGADINRYILGDVDWERLVNAISTAFIVQIQEQVYAQLGVAVNALPSRFKGTGTLSGSTIKAQFDQIIENVSAANNGADVVISGTKAALSKLSGLADVNFIANAMKDNVMNTGLIGIYEGTRLVVTPNRFKDTALSQYVFPTNELYILPVIGEGGKFIKMIDEGDIEILEVMEKGDYLSDIQTYEVSRRFGVGCVLGRYFGKWTI